MGWSDWIYPDLSLETQLALEAQKRLIHSEGLKDPKALADLCCRLIENDARRALMMQNAVKRIDELECKFGIIAHKD